MQIVHNVGASRVFVMKIDAKDVNTLFLNTDYDNEGILQYAYANFADAFSDNILEYAFAYINSTRRNH